MRSASSGLALVPCTLLMLTVLILLSASLQLVRDFQSTILGQADRQVAFYAAEAAMLDAKRHLEKIDDPLSLSGSEMVYEFGSITGDNFPSGGRLQTRHSPVYLLQVLSADASEGVIRITATGTGWFDSTKFSLQADYAVAVCPENSDMPCERQVSQISRRELIMVDP